MGFPPKPNQLTDLAPTKAPEIAKSEVNVDRLIEDALYILYREIKNLFILSAKGKLEAADARDLRDHTKLLFELKVQINEALRNLTDDQLKAKAEEALKNESK
jgi:hypothetical protein